MRPGEGAGLGWNVHRPEPDGGSGLDESCGHMAGDTVLRELTRRLAAVLRPNEFLGR